MKRKIISSIIFIVICILVAGIGADNKPEKRVMKYIAVMDLKCGVGVNKELSGPLTDVVINELVRTKKYTVIDRANRDKILKELNFQMAGCSDESCVVEAGRLLGVGKIVVGSVSKIGDTYLVTLQLTNVETAVVESGIEDTCKCDISGLLETMRKSTRKLIGAPNSETTNSQSQPTTGTNDATKCPEDMVYIPEGKFCMDIYEYPNKKGIMPQGRVNIDEAKSLCASIQKRLPTPYEWELACLGPSMLQYGYANEFEKGICNTKPDKIKKKLPSGSMKGCKSDYGTYDMVGNVWEWVDDGTSGKPRAKARGGGYLWGKLKLSDCRGEYAFNYSHELTFGYASEHGFRCAKDAK